MLTAEKKTYVPEPKVSAIHSLRCNVKSLAAEAAFIRQEEKRCGKCYRESLNLHRRGRLREEARYTHLALAFVRERPYPQVEMKARLKPDAERLHEKIKRHLWGVKLQAVMDWIG